ncbi:MAG: cytochrome c3 family protein, partial [Planctomycetota bacterium]
MSYEKTDQFVFPKWANYLLPLLVLSVLGGAAVVPPLVIYGGSAETLNVGYQPDQPVPYSHATHVGKLGMDCRTCHNTVKDAGFAAIPPTQTCVSCHAPGKDMEGLPTSLPGAHQNSINLKPVWESYYTG